ncbi:YagK/YfjJ domain-containing protein [Chromobacterium sp. CV08]|uniref:YagK/YfjJ domain-containing protein n=1 Tax=Chromobacterium sp. CV08 TaxID=3133274 RepID=UPI003DA7D7B2
MNSSFQPDYAFSADHCQSAIDLILSCKHNGYKRIMVVRVDFLIKEEFQQSMSVFEIQSYKARLWNNRRGKPSIFEHCLGWVWALEYTTQASYHYHCLFVFDADKVQADAYYGDQIGEYWVAISQGKGCYNNCNRDKERYRYRGIGRIHLDSEEELNNLCSIVIPYLAKDDNQVRSAINRDAMAMGVMPIKIRTFGGSNNLKF